MGRLFGCGCCLVAGTFVSSVTTPTAGATASAEPRQFTLHVDPGRAPEIAGKRIGTLTHAVSAFGKPAALAPKARPAASCRASWPKLGLAIEFSARSASCETANLGGWITVTASDRRWRTYPGLHVGDPEAKLHHLYPQARRVDFRGYGPAWELETGGPYCDGGPTLALAAVIPAGHITSLIVAHVPACG